MKSIDLTQTNLLRYNAEVVQVILDRRGIKAKAICHPQNWRGTCSKIDFKSDEDATHFILTVDYDELDKECDDYFWSIYVRKYD